MSSTATTKPLYLDHGGMSVEATAVDQEFENQIESLLEETDTVLVVNPEPAVFRTVILTAAEFDDDLPEMQVLATPDVLKAADDDFLLGSRVAELVDQDSLTLRTTTEIARTSVLVGDEQVMTVVSMGGELTGMQSTDEELVESMHSAFDDEWEDGEAFSLRTPPLSRVEDTLSEEFGDDVRDDFMLVLESVDRVPGEDDELDEVAIALVVAANNEELLYDISKWGEDTGVASKATFSRTKTRLEDRGVISTEKVPIDVGRPRLRVKLERDGLDDINGVAEEVSG